MIRVSVASSALIAAVCGAMLVPTLAAQPYIQGGVGFGEKAPRSTVSVLVPISTPHLGVLS